MIAQTVSATVIIWVGFGIMLALMIAAVCFATKLLGWLLFIAGVIAQAAVIIPYETKITASYVYVIYLALAVLTFAVLLIRRKYAKPVY